MLPRLPLDDRTFADLVQEMRQNIPHRLPEWTDENAHDPGITFLELFAWLSEMQQFYLSRIPERNQLKFLRLLGIARREARAAETMAAIGGVTRKVRLPRGTKLQAEDQVFETTEAARLLPLAIERIITRTEREASDRTASNDAGNSAFYAFGPDARAGSVLYLALDREPAVAEPIALSILLADGAQGISAADAARIVPSARVVWRAYCFDETTGGAWSPLELTEDETLHLSYSGRVVFSLGKPMRPVVLHPATDKPRYWLSCTLEEAGYERPPRIDRLLLNTVRVRQQDTQVEKREFDSPGTPGLAIETDSYLARYGKLRVQVQEPDGRWRDWRVADDLAAAGPEDRWCMVERRADAGGLEVGGSAAGGPDAGCPDAGGPDAGGLHAGGLHAGEPDQGGLTLGGFDLDDIGLGDLGLGEHDDAGGGLASEDLGLADFEGGRHNAGSGLTSGGLIPADFGLGEHDGSSLASDERDPIVIRFGDGVRGAVPPQGTANVRLIHYEAAFEPKLAIGRSNGLPGQTFELPDVPCRQSDSLLIQVGKPDEHTDEMVWEDWHPVADFDRSGPLDRHYVYRPDTQTLSFGNDERGAIPHACDPAAANLVIVSCTLGGGERGNIKPGLLTRWVEPQQRALGLTVTNAGYASGGAEAESIADCLQRTESEWGRPYCAVNNEDYEAIALSTPGLKVARVHVLPGYAPGREEAPAAVTVVIVPEGASRTPMPSRGFLATVAKHLDDRRLITTEVHVVAPTYVQVTVHAMVVVEPHYMEEAHRIVRVLERLLSPLDRPTDGIQGWPFGKTVSKGDIYGAIGNIKGVAFVQDLWMDAEGAGARKSAAGDILLPPGGLVYSGDHHIELISRTQL